MEVFIQVVKAGSFTAAGERLDLPKSTVSRKVTKLEQELGARLLHRTTRQLRLTEEGAAFYDRVSKALEELDEASRAVSSEQSVPRGLIRVTAPLDFGFNFLGDLVATFREKFPEVEVDVEVTQRNVNLVEEGFDLALRGGRLADSSLIATKLGDTELGLVASPSYLDTHGRPKKLADLARHRCLVFRGKPGRREWTLTGPRGDEAVDVSAAVTANDFSFLQSAAIAAAGITLLPHFTVRCDLAARRLEPVLPEYSLKLGGFYIVYPTARHVSAKVRAFRDHVIEQLSGQPWTTRAQRDALARQVSSSAV